jgi:uncharacterized protein YxjI
MEENEPGESSRHQKKKAMDFLRAMFFLVLLAVVVLYVIGLSVPQTAILGNAVSPNGKTSDQAPTLPSEFLVQKVVFASSNKFNLATAENPDLGMIDERFVSWGRTFKMYDASGTLVSIGHQNMILPLANQIEIYDGSGRTRLATFKQDLDRSLFNVNTVYTIIGPSGAKIGESVKTDFMGSDFAIKDAAGKVIVSLHRPSVNWVTDTWTVHVYNQELDDRIAPMIGAFKSAADDDNKSDN